MAPQQCVPGLLPEPHWSRKECSCVCRRADLRMHEGEHERREAGETAGPEENLEDRIPVHQQQGPQDMVGLLDGRDWCRNSWPASPIGSSCIHRPLGVRVVADVSGVSVLWPTSPLAAPPTSPPVLVHPAVVLLLMSPFALPRPRQHDCWHLRHCFHCCLGRRSCHPLHWHVRRLLSVARAS